MICEQCKSEGKRSTVNIGMTTETCMGGRTYYDEDGEYHNHDPNWINTSYSCSNGHRWNDSRRRQCWCGWPDNLKPSQSDTVRRNDIEESK